MLSQAAEVDAPALSAESRQLVREWSDPAAVAHPGWFADTPPALLDAALRSEAGRRLLGRRLRAQVPLPPCWHVPHGAALAWALGDRGELHAVAQHAGWALLRPQVLRVVSRRGIECVVQQVGRERYEAAFAPAAPLWRGDAPADLPDLADAAAGAPESLAALLRQVGWCAINQVRDHNLAALRCRMHLVAGPQSAGAMVASPWDIDAAKFVDALRGFDHKVAH